MSSIGLLGIAEYVDGISEVGSVRVEVVRREMMTRRLRRRDIWMWVRWTGVEGLQRVKG